MGSVANQAQLSLSLSNSDKNNDDNDNHNNQRPIQILQLVVGLPWFEGMRKVDVLAFVHCMDRIALVAQWLDDTMGVQVADLVGGCVAHWKSGFGQICLKDSPFIQRMLCKTPPEMPQGGGASVHQG